jgi:TatD DNase family protein
MTLFDTHCHLDILSFTSGFDQKIRPILCKTIERNNVKNLTQISTDFQSSLFSYLIANTDINIEKSNMLNKEFQFSLEQYRKMNLIKNVSIYYSIGLHPSSIDQADSLPKIMDFALSKLEDPKFVGIGEIGLDYYWEKNKLNLELQSNIFERLLEFGKKINKPVIVHCRDAFRDVYEILKRKHNGNGIIHCFTGNLEWAKKFCDLGYMISFSGIVTFKNATDIQDAAKNIPLKNLLIESDSPYLAPIPNRGKINIPAYVKSTMEFIASLRKKNSLKFAENILNNSLQIFQIN